MGIAVPVRLAPTPERSRVPSSRRRDVALSTDQHVVNRRSFLAGAAGIAATGALGGMPALADAKVRHHFRTPLWEVAYRRGIVYGASISTWMYQDDPAYARLFRREAAMLWPEDDMLWYHVKPTPTAPLDFASRPGSSATR
jgi:hypothetical protein